jgi:hypothetical protein
MSMNRLRLIASVVGSSVLYTLPAAATTSTLTENEMLIPGQRLVSPSCAFPLDMQTDGNLVLYQGNGNAASDSLWASGTLSPGGIAIMQSDGNFVEYWSSDWPPLVSNWATGTNNHPGAFITLQDDGNLVVYSGNTSLWASHTSGEILGQTCELQSQVTHIETGYVPVGNVASVKQGVTLVQCATEASTCSATLYGGMATGPCVCFSSVTEWEASTGYTSFWLGND